jgi:hypothetical protein
VARRPEVPVGEKGHHVADVEARSGGIAAHVKSNRPGIKEGRKPLRIGTLLKKTAGFKILQGLVHDTPSLKTIGPLPKALKIF